MKQLFLCLLLLALTTAAQAQRAATFGAATTLSTGTDSNPSAIAVADVNGDGKPDLLTANLGSDEMGVLLGTGNGGFSAVTTFSAGPLSQPYGIAVADVNGDSKLDVLTANFGSNSVGVLLGTGNGGFGTVTTYGAGSNSTPYSIAVADVNGDGKLDVLTANGSSSTVGVLLGTGTGSFGAVTTFPTGAFSQPYGIAVADVNGDGKPDVLTANSYANSAGVLLGTGTGSFGAITTYSTGSFSAPYAIAVADVNGDGKLDVLTANSLSNNVGVLLGTGTGSFGPVATYSTGSGSNPLAIAVADVNGDGKPDALTANYKGNTASVLLGTGTSTGSFGPATTYSTGGEGADGIAAADVNADGRLDLLMANYYASTAGVLLNTTPTQPLAVGSGAGRAVLALFPNPAHQGAATLTGATPGQPVQLLDALGRVVATTTATAAGTAALGRLAAGLAQPCRRPACLAQPCRPVPGAGGQRDCTPGRGVGRAGACCRKSRALGYELRGTYQTKKPRPTPGLFLCYLLRVERFNSLGHHLLIDMYVLHRSCNLGVAQQLLQHLHRASVPDELGGEVRAWRVNVCYVLVGQQIVF